MEDMRNRYTQRKDIYNGKEAVLFIRAREGPPNHNENSHGSHSDWGRKVAKKRQYATGKGRKEINWWKYGPWDLTDKRYWPEDVKNWFINK